MTEEKKIILVIDDMAAILEHARQLLKDEYKVIPSMSAKQALEIMSKIKPDLVLVDINMPDMDGYEFIAAMKAIDEYKDIPVFMITAEITAETEAMGYEAGAEDFILKPFSQNIMLKKIANFFK